MKSGFLTRYFVVAMISVWFSAWTIAHAQEFETGIVAGSDPQQFVENAYPVIARLSTGRLLCIFAGVTSKPAKMKIVASVSDDGGKRWSKPVLVFDHPNAEDADPNLLVDGDRVLAFSTTVPEPTKIERSLIYMRESKDGVHWES